MMAVYIIGDIHGQLDKLFNLLTEAELIDDDRRWNGGSDQVWFMGDFFDRGPSGVGVVDLVMRLQSEAALVGGKVSTLLGNHEILFLSAHRFQGMKKFMLAWKRNGGQEADMALVTGPQIAWLRNLPALARVGSRLLMHADAMFYLEYGHSVGEVNENIGAILRDDDFDAWGHLLANFAERMAFLSPRKDGAANANQVLRRFGGAQIIHAHTPIQYVVDTVTPTEPIIYLNNLCVNVDGGMYLGAPGFVYRLPE